MRPIGEAVDDLIDVSLAGTRRWSEAQEKARRVAIDRRLRVEIERLRKRAKVYFDLGDEAGVLECFAAINVLNEGAER
jgi:hypothetical protein